MSRIKVVYTECPGNPSLIGAVRYLDPATGHLFNEPTRGHEVGAGYKALVNTTGWHRQKCGAVVEELHEAASEQPAKASGGSNDTYYTVEIKNPTKAGKAPYVAECNDIIEALGMNYAEGNAFKAIWRSCAEKHLGLLKPGQEPGGVYDAEKVVFFGQRMLEQRK